jgi:replicative DNA helicase
MESYLMTIPASNWSQSAEQSLLGALLNDPARGFERIKPISHKHFYDIRNASIFAAIESMMLRHIPVDVVTVYSESKEDDGDLLSYLNLLSQGSTGAYGIGRYAEILRDKASKRALIDAAAQASEIAEGDDTNTLKIDQITTLFMGLQREQVQKMPKSLAEIALVRTQHYDDLQSGKSVAGWPTHIPALDRMLNGGLRPGGLYIVAARPSVGKSSLSQSIGMNQAKDGRKVLFLSMEMANEELADRGVSNSGRINYSNLLSGNLSQDDWGRASEALGACELSNFYVDDQGALTLTDIRAKAKLVPGLSVLELDYMQLCAGDGSNRNSEIEQISRGLKALAKELGIAIIALSQLNRQVEQRVSKRPNLSDLRDSGAIEQDADVVIFMWPVRDLDHGAKLIGIGVDKNRQGRTGQFGVHFDGSVQRWEESTESVEFAAPAKAERGFSAYP